jgi:cytidylate kinase
MRKNRSTHLTAVIRPPEEVHVSSSGASPERHEYQPGSSVGVSAVRVPPIVTLAALYGAGGPVVGPRVAEHLGVPFLDRGILAGVAAQMRVAEVTVAAYDSDTDKEPRSGLRRYFESLGRATAADGTPVSQREIEEGRYRSETEKFLASATARGGVVLGRGGAVVLRSVPGVLHVMLYGPRAARVEQVMRINGVDRRIAELQVDANDRARKGYVHRAYGVNPEDPLLYHLKIDSTALDLDLGVDLIVAAARFRARQRAGAAAGE